MKSKEKMQKIIHGWLPKAPNTPIAENLTELAGLTRKRTFLLAIGAILTIIGSFAVLFIGMLQVMPSITWFILYITHNAFKGADAFEILPFGLLNISSFIISLKAGTLAIGRRRYKFAVAGPIFLLFANLMTALLVWATIPISLMSYLNFGLPVSVISIISLISLSLSKKEFRDYKDKFATNGD